MEERKIGLIPRVVIPGAAGPKEYGVLVTDRRSIFVLEKSSKATVGWALGGVIGAVIAEAATSRKTFDYENMNPDVLAAGPKNIEVPHESLQRLRLKRSLGGYTMLVEYADVRGKRRKLRVGVAPEPGYIKERKREGTKPKAAMQGYAESVREVYARALPPVAAQRAEWQL